MSGSLGTTAWRPASRGAGQMHIRVVALAQGQYNLEVLQVSSRLSNGIAGPAHLDLIVAAPDAHAWMPVEAACLLPYLFVHLRRDANQ